MNTTIEDALYNRALNLDRSLSLSDARCRDAHLRMLHHLFDPNNYNVIPGNRFVRINGFKIDTVGIQLLYRRTQDNVVEKHLRYLYLYHASKEVIMDHVIRLKQYGHIRHAKLIENDGKHTKLTLSMLMDLSIFKKTKCMILHQPCCRYEVYNAWHIIRCDGDDVWNMERCVRKTWSFSDDAMNLSRAHVDFDTDFLRYLRGRTVLTKIIQ